MSSTIGRGNPNLKVRLSCS